MSIRSTFAAILAPLLLAACGSSPEQQLADAQAAYAKGDFGGAKAALIEALHEAPDDARMLHLLGLAQLRMLDPEGAMKTAARLRRLGQTGSGVSRIEAEALLVSGKAREAIDRLGRDGSSDAWRIRAGAWLARGQTARALDAFKKGMAAGDDVRLATDFAHFMLATQDVPGALAVHKRMQAFAPDAFETLMVAGDIAATRGHDELALKQYQLAEQTYPSRFESLIAQAGALERLGWLDQAIEKADAAAKIAPARGDIADLRLRLLATKGDWAQVRAILQPDETTLDPVSMRGMTYGEALLRLGHAEQARAMFQRTVLLAPENRYARMMLGEAQLATGDAASAYRTLEPLTLTILLHRSELELVERAARESGAPEAGQLRAKLESPEFRRLTELAETGEQALLEGKWRKAMKTYRAVPGYEGDPDVLLRLAMAANNLGESDAALDYADRAINLAPTAGETLHMAGLVRLTSGRDLARALELLRGAVSREPGNIEFQANLAKAEAAAG